MPLRSVHARVVVSAPAGGAVACVDLHGDVEQALRSLSVAPVNVGTTVRRRVPVDASAQLRDEAVIGRWTADHATVMTHGGTAVVNGFLAACRAAGIEREDPACLFVEAECEVERRMLAALTRAASPAAIDLLLDQPRRWRGVATRIADGRDRVLRRLIDPALVVAVGPPNIGKSSLLNALAGRSVSLVADQPGTTRDHVGTLIDLAGVVVRWVDTPGLDGPPRPQPPEGVARARNEDAAIQAEGQRLARDVALRADVLLLCADATASIKPPPTAGTILRIGLRDDLGILPAVDASVSTALRRGIDTLVRTVRDAVVPEQLLSDGKPWMFWEQTAADASIEDDHRQHQ